MQTRLLMVFIKWFLNVLEYTNRNGYIPVNLATSIYYKESTVIHVEYCFEYSKPTY